MSDDERWMRQAIKVAKQAEQLGEVPVGAVLVEDNEFIAEGWNQPITRNDPTAHAEIQVLRLASARLGNYRLPGKTLYVTLEPCVMCSGAIFHARISRVVFGAYDPRAGAASSILNLFSDSRLNHHAQIEGGLLQEECAVLLSDFFKGRR